MHGITHEQQRHGRMRALVFRQVRALLTSCGAIAVQMDCIEAVTDVLHPMVKIDRETLRATLQQLGEIHRDITTAKHKLRDLEGERNYITDMMMGDFNPAHTIPITHHASALPA